MRGRKMVGFFGFEKKGFPGVAQLAWLKANTNLGWCGYYLGPAPRHPDARWMGQRAALQSAGWGIAPIYVGLQLGGRGSHIVTQAQGAIDGSDAVAKMAD